MWRARRYGQRALVNENVGSLVNTLTLYQHTDLRLEAFARQLSEEWDVAIFVDFIIAQNLCLQVGWVGGWVYAAPGCDIGGLDRKMADLRFVPCRAVLSGLQPSKVACIEYPRDAGKDEQYPWVCLWKAVAVADSILGARAQVGQHSGSRYCACPQHTVPEFVLCVAAGCPRALQRVHADGGVACRRCGRRARPA